MKKTIALITSLLFSNYVIAGSCDSACITPNSSALTQPATVSNPQPVGNANQYTSSSITQTQTGTCPSGFTVNGSPTYTSATRQIITYYLGGEPVGTNTTPWQDTNTDCTSIQTQTLPCPSGYSGTIYQQRVVSTGDAGYEYGPWNTVNNSCVQQASGHWVFIGYTPNSVRNGPECAFSIWLVSNPTDYQNKLHAPCVVNDVCHFQDDMTTRQINYQCKP